MTPLTDSHRLRNVVRRLKIRAVTTHNSEAKAVVEELVVMAEEIMRGQHDKDVRRMELGEIE